MINCAIIGYGYWGPNLVRNFSATPNATVKLVADLRQERLNLVKKNYPTVEVTTDIDSIWSDNSIDAVIIATPVFTHFELAQKALNSGKHVLLEKPMTDTVAHALELIDLANAKGKVLMVDHTFLYTSSVQKMKSLIDNGDIGKVKYFDSTRINLGLIQQDVNVLWDLAPHDISILDYLMPEKPHSVQATGVSHIHNGIENIAYLTVNYSSDFIAHFSCSWSSTVKIRTMLLGGDKKMVVFNDMEPTEKIKIYDTAHTVSSDEEKQRVLVDYRVGDVYIPKLEIKEALGGMAKDFMDAIEKGTTPLASWKSGLNTIRILEAAQISIKEKGREVVLS
ncbi:MAG: Gfo/Idh/MocA family oxidoreductase [Flavobacteriales bacterium]|nr:Gfo/Idh/MocA family oxidoreductase [Flavobacteriales bacterium]